MKFFILPGYKDLFGETEITYEELLFKIPTDLILRVIISINNELNSGDSFHNNQERIRRIISHKFTNEQRYSLESAFQLYREKVPQYSNVIFGRRYLLAMFMKELKRDNKCEYVSHSEEDDYNFLLAYFLIIDEVNKTDRAIGQKFKEIKNEEHGEQKILWQGTINQYEFNHKVNSAFEIFKLTGFAFFIYNNYKPFLIELLKFYRFKNLSEFIASYFHLAKITTNVYNSEILQKLQYIDPAKNINRTHLEKMSINRQEIKSEIRMSHIREFPLYETSDRGFMIIDEDIYRKKIYNGPLFDLYNKTSLKEVSDFTSYKTKVSEFYFEKICFKVIFEALYSSSYETVSFDNYSKGYPDFYHRRSKTVTIVEFKDYLFPDNLIDTDDFEKLIEFLNVRFISNQKGKKKGISQLAKHVNDILNMNSEVDSELKSFSVEKLKIYPIICHTEFMFSMPGINEYLNQKFHEEMNSSVILTDKVQNVTLISLQTIFEIVRLGGDMKRLNKLIERYWKIIKSRRAKYFKSKDIGDLIQAKVSFDEIFDTIFINDEFGAPITSNKKSVDKMLSTLDFKQDILDEILNP